MLSEALKSMAWALVTMCIILVMFTKLSYISYVISTLITAAILVIIQKIIERYEK